MTELETGEQIADTDSDFKQDYDPSNVEPDFVVDEPSDNTEKPSTEPLASTAPEETDKPLVDDRHKIVASSEKPAAREPHRDGNGGHRISGPSQVLFLPNMSPHANERDLADLSKRCPGKVRKTFMYMSSSAHHGFVECESIEDASRILDWINNSYIEVRGKRVFAEYSRRKNVEDRSTYEHRQSIRKEHNGAARHSADRGPYRKDDYVDDRAPYRRDRGPSYRPSPSNDTGAYRAIDRPPHRRDDESYRGYRDGGNYRRRSRSPPARGGPPRSPPRSYPPRGEYREDRHYRQDRDQYSGYPPPGYPPQYDERQYNYDRRPQQPAYDDYAHAPQPSRPYHEPGPYRQPPPHYDDYRAREQAYHPPPGHAPHGSAPYYPEPLPPYQPKPSQAPVAHPLLSLQPTSVSGPAPVRPTPIGTRPPPAAYPPYPYK